MKIKAGERPNSSNAITRLAKGHLVTPQKRDAIPIAAPRGAESPKYIAAAPPRAAPIKNVGTISPPLKPADTVITVKSSFNNITFSLVTVESYSAFVFTISFFTPISNVTVNFLCEFLATRKGNNS